MRLVTLLTILPFSSVALAAGSPSGSWVKYQPSIPVERDQPSMAYDQARGEIVLFGGNNADSPYKRNDTWTWDGTRWVEKHPATSPSERLIAAMAFDPIRGVVLLFGGFDSADPNGGYLGDTWIWNGSTWTQQAPANSPPPRYGASMAYDAVSGTLLLFGGYGVTGELNDTWAWNGIAWTELHPAASPPARTYPTMATDLARNAIVLFGGFNFFGGYELNDTWTWDGRTWTQQLPVTSPPGRSFAGMAPDLNEDIVLFGGSVLLADFGDTWTWNGTNWTPRSSIDSPSGRAAMGMAYDSTRRKLVLFGGQMLSGAHINYLDDTWTWDGAQWSKPPLAVPPPRRNEAGMAYETVRQEVVLFGGWNGSESLGDTWVWDGDAWAEQHPATAPPERNLAGMAYDAARSDTVLFGGFSNGARLSDTWTWDGQTWTLRTPVNSPPPRYGGTMAYDSVRNKVVLFGGSILGGYQNDTWTWDGTTWTEQHPVTAPSPRYRPSMAYHAATGTLVLFGGFDSSFNLLNDTWTWDGTTWTKQQPSLAPSPRYSAGMSDDAASGALVLFGGSDDSGTPEGEFGDTWTWDGTTWTEHQLATAPTPSFSTSMANDAARGKVLLFGGASIVEGALRDTWFWQGTSAPPPVQLASVVSRKSHGSAGSFGINLPLLGSRGIECRSGGVNGNYELVFTFTNPLTNVGGASVTGGIGAVSSGAIDGSDARNYIVNLTAVTNAQTITVSLTNVNDAAGNSSANISASMGMLMGDTNSDGSVNSADISQTKSQSGQAVSAVNFREDVTVDGSINSADISLMKSKSGTGLP